MLVPMFILKLWCVRIKGMKGIANLVQAIQSSRMNVKKQDICVQF